MQAISLPVSLVDPMMIAPAAAAELQSTENLESMFADILMETEASLALTSLALTSLALTKDTPTPAQSEVPQFLKEAAPDLATPIEDEPALPKESPSADTAALAYAFVLTMPAAPEPIPEPLDLDKELAPSSTKSSHATPVAPEPRETKQIEISQEALPQEALLLDTPPPAADFVVLTPVANADIPVASRTPALPSKNVESRPAVPTTTASRIVSETGEVPPRRNISEMPAATPLSTPTRDAATPVNEPVILEARITIKDTQTKPVAEAESPTSDAPQKAPEGIASVKEIQQPAFSRDETESEDRRDPAPQVEQPTKRTDAAPLTFRAPDMERTIERRSPEPAVLRQTYIPKDEAPQIAAQRAPLKHMEIRIPDANGNVTVQLQERAGAVHVSVRSSDTQIAGSIAQGLPDLTRNLDQQGFRAETWTPRDTHFQSGATERSGLAHTEVAASATLDYTPAEQEQSERQSNPEWQQEQRKRPKRPSEEDFKENL